MAFNRKQKMRDNIEAVRTACLLYTSGFYRVAADAVDTLLPVIKDFLKDPVANAEILASHKVDLSLIHI